MVLKEPYFNTWLSVGEYVFYKKKNYIIICIHKNVNLQWLLHTGWLTLCK